MEKDRDGAAGTTPGIITSRADSHRKAIVLTAAALIDQKYEKGQKEHGGYLPDMGIDFLLNAAIEEAVDQLVYLLTLRQEIRVKALLTE